MFLLQKSYQELNKLTIHQASICISEPPESPTNDSILITQHLEFSPIPSPPHNININISPGSPPLSPKENHQNPTEQNEQNNHYQHQQDTSNSPDERPNLMSINHPATINEEHEDGSKNKSSLSLPVDSGPMPTATTQQQSLLTANNYANTNGNTTGNHTTTTAATIPKPTVCERSQSDRRKLSVSNIMSFGEQRRRSTSSIFSDMRKMSITNFDSLKSPGIGEVSSILFYYLLHFFISFPISLNWFSKYK